MLQECDNLVANPSNVNATKQRQTAD